MHDLERDQDAIIEVVISQVSILCGVTVEEIRGQSRLHRISHARGAVYWLLRRKGMNCVVIGRALKRDSSTARFGATRIQRFINSFPTSTFAQDLCRLDSLTTLQQVTGVTRVWCSTLQGDVLSYMATDILYQPSGSQSSRLRGLWNLANYPSLRESIKHAFTSLGLPDPTPQICDHARKFGYRFVS